MRLILLFVLWLEIDIWNHPTFIGIACQSLRYEESDMPNHSVISRLIFVIISYHRLID
jgi:hypothetical protein